MAKRLVLAGILVAAFAAGAFIKVGGDLSGTFSQVIDPVAFKRTANDEDLIIRYLQNRLKHTDLAAPLVLDRHANKVTFEIDIRRQG